MSGLPAVFSAWMTDAWDNVPSPLNLLDPVSPTKRELLDRLREANPDLTVFWLPRFVLGAPLVAGNAGAKSIAPREACYRCGQSVQRITL